MPTMQLRFSIWILKFAFLKCTFLTILENCEATSAPNAFVSSSNMFSNRKPDRFIWESKLSHGLRSRHKRSMPNVADSKLTVDEHNRYRATIGDEGEEPIPSNMLYMTWDPSLAITSMIYAKKCIFEHSTNDERTNVHFPGWVGENLWGGKGDFAGPVFNPAVGIEAWFLEYKDYDFDTHHCVPGKMCGHYTQVVWAESYKVGCAWLNCSTFDTTFGEVWNDATYMVCHYAPGGNIGDDIKLYEVGPRCSACPPNDTCPDGRLCRNPIRDKILPPPSDGGHIFTLLLTVLALILLVGAWGYYTYAHRKEFVATWRKRRKIGHKPESKSPPPPPPPVENPESNGNCTALPGVP